MASTGTDVCVIPLSSPYTSLPRFHFYAMTLALILPLPRGWLFRASLAAFTTKTITFAVDAVLHLSHLRSHRPSPAAELFDLPPTGAAPLELVVTLEMLCLACLVAVWLLVVSKTASVSAARGLMRVWAVSVAIGAIVAFVATKEMAQRDFGGGEDCRGRAAPLDAVFGPWTDDKLMGEVRQKMVDLLRLVGVPALVFAALTLLFMAAKGPLSPENVGLNGPSDVESGGVGAGTGKSQLSTSPDVVYSKTGADVFNKAAKVVRALLTFAVPAMFIVVVHRTETYLLGMDPAVPESEPMESVGQWGVWAGTGVVVLGTAVNAVKEKMGAGLSK